MVFKDIFSNSREASKVDFKGIFLKSEIWINILFFSNTTSATNVEFQEYFFKDPLTWIFKEEESLRSIKRGC